MTPVDINKNIVEVLKLMAYQLKISNIKVIRRLDKKIPQVLGDAGQMEQVYLNLISNAMKAMPKGGSLTIKTLGKKGTVEISFMNSGKRISEQALDKIFEPFFTVKNDKGAGLGLPIVYAIIKSHRGTVDVESTARQGTRVRILLPALKRGRASGKR